MYILNKKTRKKIKHIIVLNSNTGRFFEKNKAKGLIILKELDNFTL